MTAKLDLHVTTCLTHTIRRVTVSPVNKSVLVDSQRNVVLVHVVRFELKELVLLFIEEYELSSSRTPRVSVHYVAERTGRGDTRSFDVLD